MAKILILEDNFDYKNVLVNSFKDEFEIISFSTVEEAKDFNLEVVDLFLLDWEIEGSPLTGRDLCSYISNTIKLDAPIIMVTGRVDPDDLESGLKAGAVDYIMKPYDLDLLKVKVNNHLMNKSNREKKRLEYKDITLNVDEMSVNFNGKEFKLTKKPFDILFHMLKNPNKVYTRDEINNIINYDVSVERRNIDTHIVKLRKLFDPIKIIRTVHGIGYKINY